MFLAEGHRRLTESSPDSQYSFLVYERVELREFPFYSSISILLERTNFLGEIDVLQQFY